MRTSQSETKIAIARHEYSPYKSALPDEAARLLEEVHVRNVSAIYYECSPGYAMPPRRIGDDMFYYIVAGRGEVSIEDRRTALAAGACAHFARGVLHSACTDPSEPWHVIAVHYDAVIFESLSLPQILPFPEVTRVGRDGAFHEMAGIACREYALRPAGWKRGLEALMLRLLLFFLREHSPAARVLPTARWQEVRRVLPALELMRTSLHRAITIKELASICNFSEPQFRRVFARALGSAPNEYLRRLRLEEAALLLRRSDDTIEAIASRVGYSDPSFFAHSFKALMGTSPGKYRVMNEV